MVYILNTFSKYNDDYAISTRNSYYKNVELQREKNSYQNSTTYIVDSFYNSENVDNLNEKNESKQRNGTMNSTPEGMIQIHNINSYNTIIFY